MTSLLLLAAVAVAAAAADEPKGSELPRVLFFANPMSSDNDVIRRTRPGVLSVAERNFAELSQGVFDATITQDGTQVNPENLARYRAVVFFTAINPPGVDKDGLIEWVRRGGSFVGIHSTANTYQNYPAFGAMLGARFDRRPWRTRANPQTQARVIVEDRTHPATRHLEKSFEWADDLYEFKDFDRDRVQLLLRLDPASLDLANPKVNRQDKDFPVSWAKDHGQGRVFYTALGDWEPAWKDPRYRTHLIEGIRWTMKLEAGRPPAPASREGR